MARLESSIAMSYSVEQMPMLLLFPLVADCLKPVNILMLARPISTFAAAVHT